MAKGCYCVLLQKHYVILHLLVEFALYMFCNLGAKVIKILKSYAAFYRKRVAILEKMDCNPLYFLYIRVKITLSYTFWGELITAEPTLQPYLLQRSSRPCSYRQPEHSEADRHRRPESTWQLRESSYQRSNRDPLPYHR